MWVIPATAARPGAYRSFLDAEKRDGEGPFVDDVRVRRFGAVTLREQGASHDGRSCSFTAGKTRKLTVSSRYGCDVLFDGDLNADGIADFIVRTGGECTIHDDLLLSTTTGWVTAAARGAG